MSLAVLHDRQLTSELLRHDVDLYAFGRDGADLWLEILRRLLLRILLDERVADGLALRVVELERGPLELRRQLVRIDALGRVVRAAAG
jgi:hypothetical protein